MSEKVINTILDGVSMYIERFSARPDFAKMSKETYKQFYDECNDFGYKGVVTYGPLGIDMFNGINIRISAMVSKDMIFFSRKEHKYEYLIIGTELMLPVVDVNEQVNKLNKSPRMLRPVTQ
jgi:hypothetical protein